MSNLRRPTFGALLYGAILAAGFAPIAVGQQGHGRLTSIFLRPPISVGGERVGAAGEEFVDLASHATQSIHVAAYSFGRLQVHDALIEAHKRGVGVRVVGESDYEGQFDGLAAAIGADNVSLDNRSSYQHNKFAIFDRAVTWTGSANFTDEGFQDNAENVLVITSTQLAEAYTAEFEQMFAGKSSTAKSSSRRPPVSVDGAHIEVGFCPTDTMEAKLVEAIQSADESVRVAMFSFTLDSLADELAARAGEGVDVHVILDGWQGRSRYSQWGKLCQSRTNVLVEDWKGQVHDKYAVVDAAAPGSDPTVITGSANWSANAMNRNDENVLFIQDGRAAVDYANDFDQLWSDLRDMSEFCGAVRIYIPSAVLGPQSPGPLETEP